MRIGNLTRITKRQAHKLFDNGQVFRICPVKLRPGGPFCSDMMIDPRQYVADPSYTFDRVVTNFQFYNCSSEAGYYSSFWVDGDA